MTNFKELSIKSVYTNKDDIIDFYNTVLEKTLLYKRVSAYLSDGIFNLLNKGLDKLYQNNGKIMLIISSEVDHETFSKIKNGYNLREKFSFLDKKEFNLEEQMIVFLIASGAMELKVAYKKSGILHDKFAVLIDENDNKILFNGSNNETLAAIENNHESFEVTLNYDKPSARELEKISIRMSMFDDMWNNKNKDLFVVNVDDIDIEDFKNRINFEQIEEKLKNIKYLNIKFDEKNIVRIYSNSSHEDILSSYEFKNIKNFFTSSEKALILKENLQYTDIKYIIEKAKDYTINEGLKFYISDRLKEFLELNEFLPEKSAILGKKIKKIEIEKDQEFISFSEEVNNSLKRPLRLPQLKSAYHFFKLKRAMNFSVPGSGKTASILGAYSYLKNNNRAKRMIVFCPLNAFQAWKNEYLTVIKESNITKVLDITEVKNDEFVETYLNNQFLKSDLVIINFERIISVSKILNELISSDDIVIYDEVHRIKKQDSRKFEVCSEITKYCNYRTALSGTPFPNGYIDLLNVFNLLFENFAQSYFLADKSQLADFDANFLRNQSKIEKFNARLFPFYMRVTKEELLIPPPNEDILVDVNFSIEDFDKIKKFKLDSSNHLSLIPRIIQFTSMPEYFSKSVKVHEIESDNIIENFSNLLNTSELGINKKLETLLQILNANRRKTIIWCNYVSTIEYLKAFLSYHKIVSRVIYGSTSIEERDFIIKEFNSNSNFEVLITNPNTLAESVSLHYNCHDAIYYELNFNLSFFLQSRDRIHRLGIKDSEQTNYYILISNFNGGKFSLDSKIYSSLKIKEKKLLDSIQKNLFFDIDKIDEKSYVEVNI